MKKLKTILMSLKKTTLIILICSTINAYSQVGGNQIYISNSSYNKHNQTNITQRKTIYTTDSTLSITVNVLMNKVADHYLISVGLNEEAKTVIECNDKINSRIDNLITSLKILNVEKNDVYIDFISQTKIYDYEVSKDQVKQFENGFEIKKNIIIRINNIGNLDQLITLCAKQRIYDIIKVEYVDADINSTYLELYNEALSLIETRKKLYLKFSSQKLKESSNIFSENFYSVSPKTQYKKYEAFESSNLSYNSKYYSTSYVQKEERKNKTFYYEGIETSNFDKIINASIPKIGLQYVLTLTMSYKTKD